MLGGGQGRADHASMKFPRTLLLATLLTPGCATAIQDTTFGPDGGSKLDSGSTDLDSASEEDTTTPTDSSTGKTDTGTTPVDTGSAADTTVADTAVADTKVADTAVADTLVADTFVADTAVTDTGSADTGGTAVGTVLVYNDSSETLADDAVVALGGTAKLTETDLAFDAAYDAKGFSVIIIDAPYDSLSSSTQTRLAAWVGSGGRLLFAYWDLDTAPTLKTAFGVSTVDYTAVTSVYKDTSSPVDLFSLKQTFPSPLAGGTDDVDDDGDRLTLTGAGFLAARLTSATGAGGIAVVGSGRVIVNGFMPYNFRAVDADSDGIKDVRELWENELTYVLSK